MSGEADDDEPEPMTIERVEKEDPKKLEPLPYAEGLENALKHKRASQEHKFGKPIPRGDKAHGKSQSTDADAPQDSNEPPRKKANFQGQADTPPSKTKKKKAFS